MIHYRELPQASICRRLELCCTKDTIPSSYELRIGSTGWLFYAVPLCNFYQFSFLLFFCLSFRQKCQLTFHIWLPVVVLKITLSLIIVNLAM
jgi:hypothetical protein